MILKNKSSSTKLWKIKYLKDKYVKESKNKKLSSRAWFKLSEIQKKDKLFNSGMMVLDLGSSPGGWSKFLKTQLGKNGIIIACDILSMDLISNIFYLKGSIFKSNIIKNLLIILNKKKIDVLISDISPNISGISEIDIPKFINIFEKILYICNFILKKNGSFLIKVFQGEKIFLFIKKLEYVFNKIKIRKPHASWVNSKEIYIIAKGYKNKIISN